jgi:hypothetical protein
MTPRARTQQRQRQRHQLSLWFRCIMRTRRRVALSRPLTHSLLVLQPATCHVAHISLACAQDEQTGVVGCACWLDGPRQPGTAMPCGSQTHIRPRPFGFIHQAQSRAYIVFVCAKRRACICSCTASRRYVLVTCYLPAFTASSLPRPWCSPPITPCCLSGSPHFIVDSRIGHGPNLFGFGPGPSSHFWFSIQPKLQPKLVAPSQ